MSYWDTSALAKIYLQESDSTVFRSRAVLDAPLHTAHLTLHELRTVLLRRESEGVIQPGGAALLFQDFEADIAAGLILVQTETPTVQLEFVKVLEQCFLVTPPVFIRTNDALHIACARTMQQRDFITADNRQKAAAAHVGLRVS
ncbi:MAG: type II toxin-antitoxin system VapC family toxin [Prosthecobacter sp.]|uniref:type II toxin-antitoxin system VapC family toxin n=1 Tax=Prosthecobacter sp. TaxID=1965333 RepID=UPI003BAF692F